MFNEEVCKVYNILISTKDLPLVFILCFCIVENLLICMCPDTQNHHSNVHFDHGPCLQCPDSCEGGTATRTVVCSTQEGRVYPDDTCDLGRKPTIEQPCPSACVPKPKWHASEWGQVSSGIIFADLVCSVLNRVCRLMTGLQKVCLDICRISVMSNCNP